MTVWQMTSGGNIWYIKKDGQNYGTAENGYEMGSIPKTANDTIYKDGVMVQEGAGEIAARQAIAEAEALKQAEIETQLKWQAEQLRLKANFLSSPSAIWASEADYTHAYSSTEAAISDFQNRISDMESTVSDIPKSENVSIKPQLSSMILLPIVILILLYIFISRKR